MTLRGTQDNTKRMEQETLFPQILPDEEFHKSGHVPPRRSNEFAHNLGELPVNNWFSIVAGYSGSFVSDSISNWALNKDSLLLDPFSGTGTSIISSMLNGVQGTGVEANPFHYLAGLVKTDWSISKDQVLERYIALKGALSLAVANDGDFAWSEVPTTDIKAHLSSIRARGANNRKTNLIIWGKESNVPHLTSWISPKVLEKALDLGNLIFSLEGSETGNVNRFVQLAYGSILMHVSNMKMHGPKIAYRRRKSSRIICERAPVYMLFLQKLGMMMDDLNSIPKNELDPHMHLGSATDLSHLTDESVDGAITSPPYLNEVDYLDNTRLELYLLGLVRSDGEMRHLKERLIRANTKHLFKTNRDYPDNLPDLDVFKTIKKISSQVRLKGKERSWGWDHPRMVAEYFVDMTSHIREIYRVLKRGASYRFIVGDSAINGFHVPTDEILGDIGIEVGFSKKLVEPFRSRGSSRHRFKLRETIITLTK